MEKDLISIIVPMYNMEKFIAKCLDSICAQTYKNLEIICVNDGSPDKSAEIAESYAENDNRIKVIHNEKNLGLFRARVEGMKVAKGQYIAHVDADDFISVDWFRLLHKKAIQENADMTLGNTINVDQNGHCNYYNNYRSLTASHVTLQKKDLLKLFFEQEGSCFVWHTIWNKLYTKKLIDECMPYFEKINYRLIMGEDIAFSSVLWTHANSLAFANVDGYFYYRHSEASTSVTLPLEKIINNIKDLKGVFSYLELCLKEYDKNIYKKHLKDIESFKNRYHRIWSGNVWAKNAQNNKLALEAMEYTFEKKELSLPTPHEFYFYELSTPWSDRYENIKKQILSDNIKVVSFDIFDTLIKRPLYTPQDIFMFVGKLASKLLPSTPEKTFAEQRKMAENIARQNLKINKPQFEDITLTEIYDAMSTYFDIDKNITDKLKSEEIRLEKSFCKARKTGKEIFDFALYCGKKVVLTSDMYLEKTTVEEILKENDITGYSNLFLSSEHKLLKTTGNLFSHMLKSVDAKPQEVIHIGDNWNVDIIKANSYGINALFLPKATETFENGISDIYTGKSASIFKTNSCTIENKKECLNQLPIRSMIGVISNKLFDNPFNSYQSISDYNGDAYHTGYQTLGMHVFGIAKWILDNAQNHGYKKIIFLARDGKMVKDAFDYLSKSLNINIESDYFYATRKSLMPYSINKKSDLYNLCDFMDIHTHSPIDVLNYCKIILKPVTDDIKKEYFNEGIILEQSFADKFAFKNFIDKVIKISFDENLLKSAFTQASNAFEKIFTEKSATFDMGYSGRLQSIICNLANKPIDTFYIHSNADNTKSLTKHKFKIHSFYDFTPVMTGIVREFIMSDPTASCVKYSFKNDFIEPIFEEKEFAYETTYAISEMQKGAVDFCKDFVDCYNEFINDFDIRNVDVSIPFEHYLLNAPEFDRYIFSSALVEDNVYGGYDAKSVFDIWTWHQNQLLRGQENTSQPANINLHDSMINYISRWPKLKRAAFWFLFDRKIFKEKWKKNMKKGKENDANNI